MAEARYVCCAILAFLVADGQIHHAEVEFVSTKEHIEVAKGVEIAKEVATHSQQLIVFAEHYLGAAEGILNGGLQHPGEKRAKEMIAKGVEQTHRAFLHRVDQAHTVYELTFACGNGAVEFG